MRALKTKMFCKYSSLLSTGKIFTSLNPRALDLEFEMMTARPHTPPLGTSVVDIYYGSGYHYFYCYMSVVIPLRPFLRVVEPN